VQGEDIGGASIGDIKGDDIERDLKGSEIEGQSKGSPLRRKRVERVKIGRVERFGSGGGE